MGGGSSGNSEGSGGDGQGFFSVFKIQHHLFSESGYFNHPIIIASPGHIPGSVIVDMRAGEKLNRWFGIKIG
jgi:hypothetical protein